LTATIASEQRQTIMREAAAFQNAILLEAVVAAYALMAHADGEVAGAERRRLFAMVRDTPAFEPFSRDDVAEEAAVHEANYRLDPELAQQIAWEKLDLVAGQRRIAHLLIGACRELIPADGVAHPAEYRVLSEIKSRLGVDDLPPLA
jgi:tellurite resistance protein